ncbi:MAG: hypothetical protein HN909_00580, partial [Phycisphaerales bacterium]|nr:hypothetical protein [Phycisphaerales bacterium]
LGHTREVQAGDTCWVVRDHLAVCGTHTAVLRWFLPKLPATLDGNTLTIETPSGPASLTITADAPIELQLREEQESLTYGQLSPVWVLETTAQLSADATLETTLQLPPLSE